MLGWVLFLFVGGQPRSRLAKEVANLTVYTLGAPGTNSSGRPGGDPLLELRDYPPILLSALAVGAIALAFLVRKLVQREAAPRRPKPKHPELAPDPRDDPGP